MQGPCSVDGCDRVGRISRGMCQTHYFRVWRGGSAGSGAIKVKRPGAVCDIEGCGKPHSAHGLCGTHESRLRRVGDPNVVRTPQPKFGEDNNMWSGDRPTYGAAHMRMRKVRGRAKDQACACGSTAAEWAYDHADPNELTSKYGPYSTDPAHYVPMCIRCHRLFDENPIAMGRATAKV